jgi:hypothetical protein
MDDAGEARTKRSLNRQVDAKAGINQAFFRGLLNIIKECTLSVFK